LHGARQKQTFLLALRVIRSDIIQLRDSNEGALNHLQIRWIEISGANNEACNPD
jgi:hypothetical protein